MTGRNPDPYTFAEARQAFAQTARMQAESETFRLDASRQLAEAERVYRMALARRILDVHADGCAWTVAQDLARGDDKVAGLRYERDVARGVLDAAEQKGWRCAADRKACQSLVEWSARVSPLGEQHDDGTQHPTFGARRAA